MITSTHLVLAAGAASIAIFSGAQESRPTTAESPQQQERSSDAPQDTARAQMDRSISSLQRQLHSAAQSELQRAAQKCGVQIDGSSASVSLLGANEIVAGAACGQSTLGERSGRDAAADDRRTGRDATGSNDGQDARSARGQGLGQDAGRQTGAQGEAIGIVFASKGLIGDGSSSLRKPADDRSADRSPRSQDDPSSSGAITTQPADSADSEFECFQVRQAANGTSVELVNDSGRVALTVEMIGADDSSKMREASSPRRSDRDVEDASVGRQDLPETARTDRRPMGKSDEECDWNTVYASIVHELSSSKSNDRMRGAK